MSEEFELLDVLVRRVQVDNVVIKVPKGYRPCMTDDTFWDVMKWVETLRPETAKTWRPEALSLSPMRCRVMEPGENPYHIDARFIIAKLAAVNELQKEEQQ